MLTVGIIIFCLFLIAMGMVLMQGINVRRDRLSDEAAQREYEMKRMKQTKQVYNMESSNKKEIAEGLPRVLAFFGICAITALIGSSAPGWLFLFMPVSIGGFAYWVSNKGTRYAAYGAGLGLVFALLINLFGV